MDNRNIVRSSSSSSGSSFDNCSDMIFLLRNSGEDPMGTDMMPKTEQGDEGSEQSEFVGHECFGSKKMNPRLVIQEEINAENGAILSNLICKDFVQSSSSESFQKLERLNGQEPSENSGQYDIENQKKEILHIGCADRVPSMTKHNFDLQQLENSIKYFDLSNPTTLPSHPTQSLSNHYDGNVYENLDKNISLKEPIDERRIFVRSLSTGMIKRDEIFGGGKPPLSASRLPWLDCQDAKVVCPGYTDENIDSQVLSKSTHSSSKSSPTGSWKFRACEKEIVDSVVWRNRDLGPDELSRYLEKVNVNENYIGNNKSSQSAVDGSLDNTTESKMLKSHVQKDIPFVIDWVEVVGTKQRKDSSVWERMVGVREHIVYCIKVVSGVHQWEVLKRYRDFMDFYRQLKRIFNHKTGEPLPSLVLEAEESHKRFGNMSSNSIEARRLQIEKCLQSLLSAGPPFSITPPLFWFLRPPQSTFANTGFEEHVMVGTTFQSSSDLSIIDSLRRSFPVHMLLDDTYTNQEKGRFTVGKNAKLILNIPSNKPLKQLLNAQNFSCSGCYKHLQLEKRMIQGFAQTLARGKPRYCEYTGQFFCSACHSNDLAVIPAHVLRHWDFSPRRVSQLAKSYLDSIYDQPLLDIGSVNSYLYLRVPILGHVKDTRTRLRRVLSCIRCHVHGRVQQTMGSRRYLLENNDFFALRELEDISKGPFSVMPGFLDAMLGKLVEHVTRECSVCRDTGEWCGAGILCKDPFCPIFPFQAEHVTSCKSCNAPFHKQCYINTSSCTACPKPRDWAEANSNLVTEEIVVQRS